MISASIERCAGIDVGKKFLAVCVMVGPLQGKPPRSRSGSSVRSDRNWKGCGIG